MAYTDKDLDDITLLALHRLAFSAPDSEASADMRDRARTAMRRLEAALHASGPAGRWHDNWAEDGRDRDGNLILRYQPSGGQYKVLPFEDLEYDHSRTKEDVRNQQITEDCAEDGEQCLRCLRYTYDPHLDLCMHCRFQMHPEEED